MYIDNYVLGDACIISSKVWPGFLDWCFRALDGLGIVSLRCTGARGSKYGVFKVSLKSQVAQNNRPLYPKVDNYWFKVACNYEPLALQVCISTRAYGLGFSMPLGYAVIESHSPFQGPRNTARLAPAPRESHYIET